MNEEIINEEDPLSLSSALTQRMLELGLMGNCYYWRRNPDGTTFEYNDGSIKVSKNIMESEFKISLLKEDEGAICAKALLVADDNEILTSLLNRACEFGLYK